MATQKLGRYEIVRELGRGGMGTVFLARDPAFDRQVAVKVLPAQLTRDPQFLARFQREAKIIAALEHPCIVPVYDYGEGNGQPYIVMRYMAGGTLTERLNQGRLSLHEAGLIVHRLADALDEAHQHGIIHRDLKPSNIMFDHRGQAFLSDFGIAKLMETNSALTGTGMVGTPAYMSPEQAEGHANVDRRSDVYSLGLIVYEMLSGAHPYVADTPVSMMYKQIHEMPSPLDTAALGLPAVTRAVVTRALAKKPEERYPTAGEFAKYLSGLQGAPLPIAPRKPVERPPPQPLTLPLNVTPAQTTSTAAPAPRNAQRWWPWGVGLAGLPIIAALLCLIASTALTALGNKATPTPTLTRTLRPTATNAPASPTPPPTLPPPTATLAPTNTVTPTFTATPTLLPSATTIFAPTVRPATRIPATNTAVALPTNTFAPPTEAPPTSVPPTEPPPTPPTNTPVPEPPTNTPVP